jgi:hypothetical protein
MKNLCLLVFLIATAAIGQSVGGRGVPNASGTVNCGGVPGGTSTTGCGGVPGTPGAVVPVPTTNTCTHYNGGTTSTCTFSANPAAGEFIAVSVWESGSGTFTVTDSSSNSYTAVAALHTATDISGVSTQVFYFGPLTGSISTISATSTAAPGGVLLNANTVTNIAASSPVDGSICYADTTGTTNVACGTSITTTVLNDFIFCGAYASAGSLTAGSGFTVGLGSGTAITQYKIQAATGAITPASVLSPSTDAATMSCVAFKPS